jgi:hypothetical protein
MGIRPFTLDDAFRHLQPPGDSFFSIPHPYTDDVCPYCNRRLIRPIASSKQAHFGL